MIQHEYASEIGKQYARLTLLSVLPERIQNRVAGRFRCSCGNVRDLPITRVTSGRRQSCGCLAGLGVPPKHGMKGSREYSSWQSMKSRCLNPNTKDYARYGGAGIRVCQAWIDSFEAFHADMGPRPERTTLDRIDPAGNYEPGNVRWASLSTQASNQLDSWTVEISGMTYDSVEAAARAHHVTAMTITRWCDGYTDPRRPSIPSVPPKSDCRRWRTRS